MLRGRPSSHHYRMKQQILQRSSFALILKRVPPQHAHLQLLDVALGERSSFKLVFARGPLDVPSTTFVPLCKQVRPNELCGQWLRLTLRRYSVSILGLFPTNPLVKENSIKKVKHRFVVSVRVALAQPGAGLMRFSESASRLWRYPSNSSVSVSTPLASAATIAAENFI